jgi:hypothetical protein
MKTLKQWREAYEPQPPNMDTVRQHVQTGDWGWLRWVLGSSNPKTDPRLVSYLRTVVMQIMEEVARENKMRSTVDLPTHVNQALALDLMAAALKVLAPEESGGGRRVQTSRLGQYFGDGEGDLQNLRKIAGKTNLAVKGTVVQRIKAKVKTLKELYARKQTIPGQMPVDFDNLSPEVKEPFIIDVLTAILKAAFPGADASGGSRTTLNTRKMDKFMTPTQKPATPDEELPQAPANWKG